MGLTDILFGRKKLKEASPDKLFALSTAAVTLQTELGLKPAGSAALTYKPLSAAEFTRADDEMRELLHVAARESRSELERRSDKYGYEWIVLRDPDFEDLVTAVHLVSSEMIAHGFGPQLLAAVFKFEGGRHPLYWIYGYKRGAFWPFIPTGDGQERDNAEELELKAKLENELPIEPDISRWFGVFDAPL